MAEPSESSLTHSRMLGHRLMGPSLPSGSVVSEGGRTYRGADRVKGDGGILWKA